MYPRLLVTLTLAAALWTLSSPSCAQEPATEAPAAEPAPAAAAADTNAPAAAEADEETSTTEVVGDIPDDLRGIWFLVAHAQLGQSNAIRNFAKLYEIDGQGDQISVHLLQRDLPAPLTTAIEEADRAGRQWSPSDEQLAQLARTVDDLPQAKPTYKAHKIKIVAADHYGDNQLGPKPEIALPESRFAIAVRHEYRPQPASPGSAQLMTDDALYGVRLVDDDLIAGEHARLFLAAAFVPIPINMTGPFEMHRLRGPGEGPPASAGLGARLKSLIDSLFRGCR